MSPRSSPEVLLGESKPDTRERRKSSLHIQECRLASTKRRLCHRLKNITGRSKLTQFHSERGGRGRCRGLFLYIFLFVFFFLFLTQIMIFTQFASTVYLWNPTKSFVVRFCSIFWPWPCTKNNTCLVSTRNKLIQTFWMVTLFVHVCAKRECSQSWAFQHES